MFVVTAFLLLLTVVPLMVLFVATRMVVQRRLSLSLVALLLAVLAILVSLLWSSLLLAFLHASLLLLLGLSYMIWLVVLPH